jgi:hypothetical protein
MAKKPETAFIEKLDALLKKTFGKDLWLENIQQASKAGTPDRLLCINGFFVGLEVKTDKGTPSKIQLLKLAKIKRAGGLAYIVTPENINVVITDLTILTTS